MQDILPMLEAHEGVYKYSWFMNRSEIVEWTISISNKKRKTVFTNNPSKTNGAVGLPFK